ncbi:MAG: hypothetical protein H6873_06885 [Hyphomicrobiaceae bacterium]|nr:hypothetical protein [Hyphomicrobiaceae bacterium]
MLPQTEDEMVALLVNAGMIRAYGELRKAALTGTTEARIKAMEVKVIAHTRAQTKSADQFKTFDLDSAVAKACQMLVQFFNAAQAQGSQH